MPYHNYDMSPKAKSKGKKRKSKKMSYGEKYMNMYDTGSKDKYGNPKGSS